jgi:eukaryotic-like serine/threonine-protein kinase
MIANPLASPDPEVQRLLDRALDDQKSSWDRGERTPVEDFLARDPALRDDSNAMLDLIYQEYLLRRDGGEEPDPHEYYARFPEHAASLMIQFGVDAAIEPTTLVANGRGPAHPIVVPPIEGIDGHEIIGVIGRGGMGVVYQARDPRLDRIVAVKTIAAGQEATADQVARFRAEAHAVARLHHPNIIAIHAIGEHEGRPYHSLEFAEGGSLAQRLAEKPMTPCDAAELLEALARAVYAAHQAGVVHRDLKPSNVLFTSDGIPKVSDFGVAKLLESGSGGTLTGQVVGTPSYMAPEQAEGHAKQVDRRADVYALGAILYQTLTGRPPFLGESALETLRLVTSTDAVPPRRLRPDVPRDLETICLKCLEKLPAKRYSTAVDLADDLRRFQGGEPVLARRINVVQRSAKWARRHPWQSVSAVVVMLAIASLVGLTSRHNLQLRAEVQRTEAKSAEGRRNYQEARSTIQAMLARLSDPRFAGIPRLKELGGDQMEDAVTFYERILRQSDSNDPTVRYDTAREFGILSTLQRGLGRTDQAERQVRQALDLIESLRSEHPENADYLLLQVECVMRLATYLHELAYKGRYVHDMGRAHQAVAAGEEAVRLVRLLVQAAPEKLPYREAEADCHQTFANCLRLLPRYSDARDHYRKAIEIRERLDPDPVKSPDLAQKQSDTLMNDGVTLCNMGDASWAEAGFREAEARFREAEARFREVERIRRAIHVGRRNDVSLAQLYVDWSGFLVSRRHDEAIARADEGLKWVEPYLRLEPKDAVARDVCLKLHGNRGFALSALGKHRESAAEWARVVELSDQPVVADYRIRLALELAPAGELDRALTEADLVKSASGITAFDCYNLACLYALAAAAVRKDQRLTPDQQETGAKALISDAFRWLKAAAAAGVFDDAARRENAKKDNDLAILRDLPEFQRILLDAQFPADLFGPTL